MAVPKLRFKEFDGDWTSKQLGKIIGISSASRVFKEQWQDSGVPFFRTSDVVSLFKNKENEKAYISLELFEELAKKSGKIKQGDLLVTGGGSIGIPYLVPNDHPLYFKDADLLWMKSSGIVEGSFLYNFFISPKFRDYLKSISHTGTISHFTIEQAKATPFGFPSKEEQTKIASFLSNVDEKISQLTQKHQLLSQYKQGMMQKLFSQQIRFKADDGSEFGEWEDKPLNEIASKRSGKNKDGSISEVLTNSATQGVIKQSDYFEREIVTESNLNGYYIVTLDDFVYNPRISVHAPVGPIKRNKKCLGVMSPLYTVFTVIQGNLKYLEYFFDSNFWHDYVKGVANSGARHDRMNITNKDFFDMPILYPCLEEQTKIANFLSAIDQKIEVVAQQIEQAKTWKKGLLQQMFV
ncbi:restriction endonuclease subunit S [Acinetobacter baumannii]|uniref:restriction endonuclease subunit S n=1 Tax=Acinetobacter baumannii TaxID=470 RepID=UPI00376F9BA8